jgi:hypothetical protein
MAIDVRIEDDAGRPESVDGPAKFGDRGVDVG